MIEDSLAHTNGLYSESSYFSTFVWTSGAVFRVPPSANLGASGVCGENYDEVFLQTDELWLTPLQKLVNWG